MTHPHVPYARSGNFAHGVPAAVWASAFADELERRDRIQRPIVVPKPDLATTAICASLPSSTAAYRLVQGDWGALSDVIVTTLGRAVLIGLGAMFFPERTHIVRNSLMGALGVEAFVLGYSYIQVQKQTKGKP